ncbi:MAG: hypothetical protein AB1716_01730 [Planctomycetota bacterium]
MRKLTGFSAIVLCAAGALGAEVVVKNDSLLAGGTGAIQVGFVSGESAAVWLTSPCNGHIVAIQVLWMSQTGGAPQAIEQSIEILEAGTFPNPLNPTNPLALLEGPVLSDGYLNEYRYLDEQQTIPIRVPVTAGQQFIISFTFENAPPPNGPSLVTDTDGCQAGKNAIYAIPPGAWFNACALGVSGDFVIRAAVDCPDQTGACCLPDGTCVVKTSSECTSAGGTYQGNGTNCGSVNCPQPSGACCFDATHGCVNLTLADCNMAGGRWGGAGTTCATYVCFPSGACCKPDGTCVDNVSPAQCSSLNGTFQGHNTQCASVNCPPPTGACCLTNGGCLVLTPGDCAIVGGVFAGPQTNCDDGNTNGRPDACERLMRGDLDCNSLVDFNDINPFVLALSDPAGYAARYPGCPIINGDCNGNGQVEFGDINPFVALLAGQ